MKISASLVKQLRDKTGAGMMDCKNALVETAGDIDQAIDWLREKGISKAAKKADRIAAEGLCNVLVKGNEAVILELNSETDFVAKNKEFLALLDTLANAILDSDATNTEEALKIDVDGRNIERVLIDATAKIGEKFSLRNVSKHTVSGNEVFGAYKHMGGRIVTLVVLEDGNADLAKDIAMHVAAINPTYLDQTDISEEVINHEREILTKEALNEGKPANIVEKMVVGRLNKYLKEICLVNQPFVKNPDLTVDKFMKENNSKIVSFLRVEVGTGIEKRVEDFASEVASVVGK
ncbi:MAG: Elongation factor Ts [Candidatus Izimaplasma bacterium HR2]|nr:MAG: Elongation factor Ts [Candidatus Izimaplasma bacterium HR2]